MLQRKAPVTCIVCPLVGQLVARAGTSSISIHPCSVTKCSNGSSSPKGHEERHVIRSGLSRRNPTNSLVGVAKRITWSVHLIFEDLANAIASVIFESRRSLELRRKAPNLPQFLISTMEPFSCAFTTGNELSPRTLYLLQCVEELMKEKSAESLAHSLQCVTLKH